MTALVDSIKALQKQSQILEADASAQAHINQFTTSFAQDYIERLPKALSFVNKEPNLDLLRIRPNEPRKIEELIQIYNEEVAEPGLRAASGGHIGYIPGGGIYAGAMGDYLAAVTNEYAGVSYASPGAVAIENEVVDWLKSVFSFPKSAVGNLTSGGSIANMIALTAARDKHGIKNEKIPNAVVYMSDQAHHCIAKALKIIGLEDVNVRHLELDERYKIKADALNEQIKKDKQAGLQPFLVIASAGTTNVGAVDPLEDIAEICEEHNLWFHVDAAYGGFFVMTSKRELFKGIEKADSLVIDPHKALFLPYGIGAVLVKDAQAVFHSHLTSGDYLQDASMEDLAQNPSNVSPELTKHFRGMRIWLPLQLYGIKPFIACLEEKILLTTYLLEELRKLGFKTGPTPDLSVGYFWYPFEGDENLFNQKLMQAIHRDGRVFFSSTLLDKKFVIRIAILSFRTRLDTVNRALEMIKDCLAEVKREMGGE